MCSSDLERMEIMRRQVELAMAYKGADAALREARKHCAWYMTGLRGAARLRREAGTISSLEDVDRLAQLAIQLDREQFPLFLTLTVQRALGAPTPVPYPGTASR